MQRESARGTRPCDAEDRFCWEELRQKRGCDMCLHDHRSDSERSDQWIHMNLKRCHLHVWEVSGRPPVTDS
jgi:hypothetical protein